MKKTLALLLALAMVVGTLVGCSKPANNETKAPETNAPQTEAPTEPAEEVKTLPENPTDDDIYDYVLGDYYNYYEQALNEDNVSMRFALEAIAEAKLLESGVFMPSTCNGGNYAISRAVPYSISTVLWGNDNYRYHDMLVTTEPIKAADRAEVKEFYTQAANAEEYMTGAKAMLEEKGYTFKDSYTIAYSQDPQTWDVLATYQQTDSEPVIQTYDGLLEYDQKNELQPALAESYTVSDDGLVYTFKLRQGVKWVDSQGREIGEVTAKDWVSGMQHMMDAQGGLEYLVDGLIVNATEYMGGEVTDIAEVGVKAVDDYTLEYTLTAPATYFITMLGYGVFAPMNSDFFLSQGGAFGIDAYAAALESGKCKYGTDNNTIAYCGPYLVTNWTPENTLVFKANDSYWNKDNINIKSLTWFYNDGQDVTKTYTDMKAGTIDGAGLNASTRELAKTEGMFDEYAYVSGTDATAFTAFWNVNRQAYENSNGEGVGATTQTPEQQAATKTAMYNVHFRRALCHAIDRAGVNALRVGEELKYNNMINSFTPGTFVKLEEDVTVDINGTATTFPAGTFYGAIVQAQLDADGSKALAFDATADDGIGSSSMYDGWYNPEAAAAELAIAVEELKAQGLEISAENPIQIDYACYDGSELYRNQGQAYKKSIEAALNGMVVVTPVPYATGKDYNDATYNFSTGAEANYDFQTNSGWGPDYGDPKSYLDTMLPVPGGMCKAIGLY